MVGDSGVGILKLSTFCLPLTLLFFKFKLKFTLNYWFPRHQIVVLKVWISFKSS